MADLLFLWIACRLPVSLYKASDKTVINRNKLSEEVLRDDSPASEVPLGGVITTLVFPPHLNVLAYGRQSV